MPSLLPGFEYDIFVSYRHNDNRSGWVTDFVNHLREELSATIKEPLSIYFDVDPVDGLLETHHVHKSLEGKLNCLIFIPILSQTYCDPKSFAWQHEFCAFNILANGDNIGREIRLANGNVAGRILPIRIHDLDPADRLAFEKEIGGPLRAIDFVYKELGVNRPLKSDDRREENVLKASYRNQMNKVANAIKEIAGSLQQPHSSSISPLPKPTIAVRRSRALLNSIATIGLIAGVLVTYFILNKYNDPADVENTILVLPFKTDENDSSQAYFAEGITADIITEIGKAKNLSPLSWRTSFVYADTKKSLKEVAEETKARYVLSGSIQKAASTLRFYVELADPYNNRTIWSNRYDKELHQILTVQKEVAYNVAEALQVRLSESEKQSIGTYKTNNFEAYDLFLQAEFRSRLVQLDSNAAMNAQALLTRAIAIDPNFAEAYALYAYNVVLISTYGDIDAHGMSVIADEAIEKAIRLNPTSADNYLVKGGIELFLKWDLDAARKSLEKGWKLTDQGKTAIRSCFCSFSNYKLVKGQYADVLGFVDTIQRRDPFYSSGPIEKMMAYYGLRNKAGIQATRGLEKSTAFVPIYDYYLADYASSVRNFPDKAAFLVLVHLGSAYYKAGINNKADSVLHSVLSQPDDAPHKDIQLALIYGARGDKEESLNWYRRAYNGHDHTILYTRIIPDLQLIADEPEVKGLLAKIGM